MSETTLSYHDGIVEGRLIENGFVSIKHEEDVLFIKRHDKHVFVAQMFGSLCALRMIEDDMEYGTSNDLEGYIAHILNQDECYQVFDINGKLHDIIAVFKLFKLG